MNVELDANLDTRLPEARAESTAPPAPPPAPATDAPPNQEQGTRNQEPASAHRTIIEPSRGWQLINVRELWRYRELLFFLCWRNVKVRYKQTVLGAAWAILQPAMMMVVFTIFFSRLGHMSSGEIPYPLFVLAGLLPWFFFSSAVTNAANSVVGSENLITKIYFPRLMAPFAKVGAALVDFLVALSLLFVMMLAFGHAPPWNILLAPLIFAVIALTATGLGTLLSALCVVYRDVRYVIPFMMQVAMFATPTLYMETSGDEGRSTQWLLIINPMTNLIAGFRACLLGGPIPWLSLAVALVISVVVFVYGCLYFRKVEDRFADII